MLGSRAAEQKVDPVPGPCIGHGVPPTHPEQHLHKPGAPENALVCELDRLVSAACRVNNLLPPGHLATSVLLKRSSLVFTRGGSLRGSSPVPRGSWSGDSFPPAILPSLDGGSRVNWCSVLTSVSFL